jgi:Membrane protein involved in colicin uptake
MADISNSLNKFKTAANGEDVRDAFVTTMTSVNNDNIAIQTKQTQIETKQAAADIVNANLSEALSGAQTNATAAAASALSAANSENQAADYAGQAETAAGTVQSKVDAATEAASQAAGSAAEAAAAELAATTKATEAATSASAASGSELGAATSATTATEKAAQASDHEMAAATSAAEAETKATEADESATTAQAAATTATTKAGEAGDSAAAAAASAAAAELVTGVTAEKIASWDAKEDAANKGAAGGYAALDETGKVPAAQLPVMDGHTHDNKAILDKITAGTKVSYDLDDFGDMKKTTYDVNENGIVDNAEKVNGHTVESDVPASAAFTDTTYAVATQTTDGLLEAADKTKLDGIIGTGVMTPEEILTEIKTVGGTGSGLDADLLDGKDATEFAPASHGLHVTFGTNVAALESGVEGTTGVAETVPRSDHTHTLPPYPDLAAHAGNAGIHTTAEKQAAWDRLKNLLRPSYMEGGGGIYLMFDGVDFSNGAQLSFVVPSNTYGDPLMINNSISMLVITKYLYKQNTTEYPTLTRGEAVTAWYDLSNDCFYLKAGSTAGDTTDLSLKIGKLEGRQLIDRREILDIKIKLDELNVVEFLNKTGIGFFDLFEDASNIDSGNTTAIMVDTDVTFTGEKILQMAQQTFEDFTAIELAIYDMERENFNVDVEVDNTATIAMNITPGSRTVGEKFWHNGEIYTITGVTES